MLDSICTKLDDYVRATYKSTGQLTLLRLMSPEGGMNPDFSKVDIVQDGDLNKSLKFYVSRVVFSHHILFTNYSNFGLSMTNFFIPFPVWRNSWRVRRRHSSLTQQRSQGCWCQSLHGGGPLLLRHAPGRRWIRRGRRPCGQGWTVIVISKYLYKIGNRRHSWKVSLRKSTVWHWGVASSLSKTHFNHHFLNNLV